MFYKKSNKTKKYASINYSINEKFSSRAKIYYTKHCFGIYFI